MKKQKIEDIFSSMENFSSVPPPELWNNIEEKLHEPKKKKITIIWWSIAASLLISLSIPSALYFNSDSETSNHKINSLQNNSLVNEENSLNTRKNKTRSIENNSLEETIKPDKDTGNDIFSPEENELVNSDNNPSISNEHKAASIVSNDKKDWNRKTNNYTISKSKQHQNSNLHDDENLLIRNKKEIAGNENTTANTLSGEESQTDKKIVIGNSKQNHNSDLHDDGNLFIRNKKEIVSNQNTVANTVSREENQTDQKIVSENLKQSQKSDFHDDENLLIQNKKEIAGNEKTAVTTLSAQQNQTDQKIVSRNSKQNHNSDNLAFKNKLSKNEALAFNTKEKDAENIFNQKDTTIIASNKFEKHTNTTDKNNEKLKTENSSTEKAIAINSGNTSQSDVLLTVEDSVQLAELQNLEKAVAESKTKKDEEIKTVSNAEKWSLEVFAGVANSENLGKDKTLGNVNQSKQTNTYGVKTNYKLNKKWAVSSGLKINELGQSVANVSYINNQQALSFPSTSDYLNQSSVLVKQNITNNSAYVFVPNNTKNSLKSDNFQTGTIDQSLKYIEMPLEVSYAIFNKNKTSISLNTGGFVGKLISNNVSLDGTSIGDNLEANDFVYGSLLSSTLQYRLYKKTHIFVEPGMNYYINPLSSQSFNQFQWAFNFGLNVSF
ncbi:hypothetical protein [Flavobacterium sp.]|uniref:hypothetical protein n=1 Tax=Flavobacterium sp. TaxID=239 RepID=UPI00326697C0